MNFFDFFKMLTNALWLLTTVLLTLVVQILWDHSIARVEQDILVMAKHVKVRAVYFMQLTNGAIAEWSKHSESKNRTVEK